METLLIILGVLAAIVAIILLIASTRPSRMAMARSTSINAPAEKIFPLINDLHAFNTWNPFYKADPAQKGTYSGPSAGVGAKYAWESKRMGVGSMTIAKTAAPSRIDMNLDFVKPFPGNNLVTFTIAPKGSASDVTWAMEGPVSFIPKVMGLFFSMDNMMGKAFDDGLADLKKIAEA